MFNFSTLNRRESVPANVFSGGIQVAIGAATGAVLAVACAAPVALAALTFAAYNIPTYGVRAATDYLVAKEVMSPTVALVLKTITRISMLALCAFAAISLGVAAPSVVIPLAVIFGSCIVIGAGYEYFVPYN